MRVMRVLIVEDTPERQKVLTSLYREHAWVLVHTAARARCLLDAYEFDLVSLDYDLAGPERGDAVAAHLARSRNAEATVIVHSQNAPGAKRIAAHLPRATYMPISRMTRSNSAFLRLRTALRRGPAFDFAHALRGPASPLGETSAPDRESRRVSPAVDARSSEEGPNDPDR